MGVGEGQRGWQRGGTPLKERARVASSHLPSQLVARVQRRPVARRDVAHHVRPVLLRVLALVGVARQRRVVRARGGAPVRRAEAIVEVAAHDEVVVPGDRVVGLLVGRRGDVAGFVRCGCGEAAMKDARDVPIALEQLAAVALVRLEVARDEAEARAAELQRDRDAALAPRHLLEVDADARLVGGPVEAGVCRRPAARRERPSGMARIQGACGGWERRTRARGARAATRCGCTRRCASGSCSCRRAAWA